MVEGVHASVSVIIPCYCCSETIERAVASVAAQTLKPAEVLLVEDYSSDNTLRVLESFQQCYGADWIKIIAQPENRGPGSARNAGWEAATQPYIAFLDADDAWHPQKIEIQFGWMRDNPEVALTGHACRFVSNLNEQMGRKLTLDEAPFRPVGRQQLLISNRFSTRSVMLRRDLPHRFAPEKRHSEDYLLWCEICLDGYSCYRSPLTLAFLFKAHYGEAGLSGNLWLMEKGELDTYTRLCQSKRIALHNLPVLYGWSVARYLHRVVKVRLFRSKGF